VFLKSRLADEKSVVAPRSTERKSRRRRRRRRLPSRVQIIEFLMRHFVPHFPHFSWGHEDKKDHQERLRTTPPSRCPKRREKRL